MCVYLYMLRFSRHIINKGIFINKVNCRTLYYNENELNIMKLNKNIEKEDIKLNDVYISKKIEDNIMNKQYNKLKSIIKNDKTETNKVDYRDRIRDIY